MQSMYPLVSNLSKACLPLRQTVCIRCIQTAVRRRAEAGDHGDRDGSSQDAPKPKPAATAANSLLNVLADIKVAKEDGTQIPLARSRAKLSAAANFQRMVTRAAGRKKEDGDNEEEERQSLGRHKMQELTAEAAKKVAETYPDGERTESDLLQQLRKHDEATAAGEMGDQEGIRSILSGIRVQKQTSMEQQMERPDSLSQGQRTMAGQFGPAFSPSGLMAALDVGAEPGENGRDKAQPYKRQRKRTLFDRHRLNIFNHSADPDSTSPESSTADSMGMTIWDIELQKQLRALSYATVHNGFEEAMKLTEEGKMWKYPIDNEQGLDEEQKVGFDEHIFLDHLLEDFPRRAAVLDFMELVLIGLGKNPYLTVAQKHEHVDWFRNYFHEKEDVLQRAEEAEREKANAN